MTFTRRHHLRGRNKRFFFFLLEFCPSGGVFRHQFQFDLSKSQLILILAIVTNLRLQGDGVLPRLVGAAQVVDQEVAGLFGLQNGVNAGQSLKKESQLTRIWHLLTNKGCQLIKKETIALYNKRFLGIRWWW